MGSVCDFQVVVGVVQWSDLVGSVFFGFVVVSVLFLVFMMVVVVGDGVIILGRKGMMVVIFLSCSIVCWVMVWWLCLLLIGLVIVYFFEWGVEIGGYFVFVDYGCDVSIGGIGRQCFCVDGEVVEGVCVWLDCCE